MHTYRLLRGDHRRRDGTIAEAGDTVQLTERQTEQFNMERFELVDASDAPDEEPVDDDTDDESAVDPEPLDETPEASTDIPGDWDLLRSMAVVVAGEYDEEISGQSPRDDIEAVLEEYRPEERAQIRQRAEARLED